jgi:hypothetical protein
MVDPTITGRFRSLAGGWIKQSGLLSLTQSYGASEGDTLTSNAPRNQNPQAHNNRGEVHDGSRP